MFALLQSDWVSQYLVALQYCLLVSSHIDDSKQIWSRRAAPSRIIRNENYLLYLSFFLLFVTFMPSNGNTGMVLSFQTARPGQSVQAQTRLLPEEQSDQGLHCLQSVCIFLRK